MTTVVFRDVEALAVAYLRSELTARGDAAKVSTATPNPRPNRLVKVTRSGGTAVYPATDRPVLIVQCWDATTTGASELSRLVRALLWALPGNDEFGSHVRRAVEVGGPAFFPDPMTTLPRYQFTVQLDIGGSELA